MVRSRRRMPQELVRQKFGTCVIRPPSLHRLRRGAVRARPIPVDRLVLEGRSLPPSKVEEWLLISRIQSLINSRAHWLRPQGESLTDAVRAALRERLARQARRGKPGIAAEIRRIQERLAGEPMLDRFIRGIGAQVVAVDEEQAAVARDAAIRYGRARHAAALNFGDCFSYALAVVRNEPLLFTGKDFAHTDVAVCSW